jgi:tetratricopeptide (TPR) repeat protein
MDDQTLSSLRAALAASPDNKKLFVVVLGALVEKGDAAEARKVLDAAPSIETSDPGERLVIARVLFGSGDPQRALAFCDGDDAEALLIRARVLAELGRKEDARQTYEKAVALNPTVEDVALRTLIDARSVESPDGSRRLKVISNDDTSDARRSLFLGLWWRMNTWLGEIGSRRAIVVLLFAYTTQRLLSIYAHGHGMKMTGEIIQYTWLAICAYSWVGPGMFARAVKRELESVSIKNTF